MLPATNPKQIKNPTKMVRSHFLPMSNLVEIGQQVQNLLGRTDICMHTHELKLHFSIRLTFSNNNNNKKRRKKKPEYQALEFSFPTLHQKTLITRLQHYRNFSSVYDFHLTHCLGAFPLLCPYYFSFWFYTSFGR